VLRWPGALRTPAGATNEWPGVTVRPLGCRHSPVRTDGYFPRAHVTRNKTGLAGRARVLLWLLLPPSLALHLGRGHRGGPASEQATMHGWTLASFRHCPPGNSGPEQKKARGNSCLADGGPLS